MLTNYVHLRLRRKIICILAKRAGNFVTYRNSVERKKKIKEVSAREKQFTWKYLVTREDRYEHSATYCGLSIPPPPSLTTS